MADKSSNRNNISSMCALAGIVIFMSLAFHFGFTEGLAAAKAYFE
jgi:hypothetical protein